MVNLRIYVHDLKKTIGHSRALIEIINHYPKDEIESIAIVSFTCDSPNDLFPDLEGKVVLKKLPFNNIKPTLLKILFYQIYSFFDLFLNAKEKTQTISIGLANPLASIIYIQFIHSQWKRRYLKELTGGFLKAMYKRLHYEVLCQQERIFYKAKNKQYICVAQFIAEYLEHEFKTPRSNISLIYSGANIREFSLSAESLEESEREIVKNHHDIKSVIESKRPVFLFVGAFERKGLLEAIEWLNPIKEQIEFIVVGQPEGQSHLSELPNWITHITHTTLIKHFYAISDYFIFPTKYEPFGLVLLEAYAMGCEILTNLDEVGASELIKNEKGVYFFDREKLKVENFLEKKEISSRFELSKQRVEGLSGKEWSERAIEFQMVLKKDSDNNLLSYLS